VKKAAKSDGQELEKGHGIKARFLMNISEVFAGTVMRRTWAAG
jgi:hypothetical protein